MSAAKLYTNRNTTINPSLDTKRAIITAIWKCLVDAGWEFVSALPAQMGVMLRQGSGSRWCVQWTIDIPTNSIVCAASAVAEGINKRLSFLECGPRSITNPVFTNWLIAADSRSMWMVGANQTHVEWYSFVGDFDEFFPRPCSFLNWWGNLEVRGDVPMGFSAYSWDGSKNNVKSGLYYLYEYTDGRIYHVSHILYYTYYSPSDTILSLRLPVWLDTTYYLAGLLPGLFAPLNERSYLARQFVASEPFVFMPNGDILMRSYSLQPLYSNIREYYQGMSINRFRRIGLELG